MSHSTVLESLSRSGGPVNVRGSSMLPMFPNGKTVQVEPAEGSSVVAGDVILIRLESGVRLHRVVGVDEQDRLITTGDSQWSLDPPVSRQAVLGRVSCVRPVFRFLDWLVGSLTLLRVRFILRG